MEWILASDRLPTLHGTYFAYDLRYNIQKVIHFNGGKNSLFYECPKQILWLEETVDEINARIMKMHIDGARANGNFYAFGPMPEWMK